MSYLERIKKLDICEDSKEEIKKIIEEVIEVCDGKREKPRERSLNISFGVGTSASKGVYIRVLNEKDENGFQDCIMYSVRKDDCDTFDSVLIPFKIFSEDYRVEVKGGNIEAWKKWKK